MNVLSSVSRVMKDIAPSEHRMAAENLKRLVSIHQEAEDLINIGAYKRGSNKDIDLSIQYKIFADQFMKQSVDEPAPYEQTIQTLIEQFGVIQG